MTPWSYSFLFIFSVHLSITAIRLEIPLMSGTLMDVFGTAHSVFGEDIEYKEAHDVIQDHSSDVIKQPGLFQFVILLP